MDSILPVSICIPAYNEARNIGKLLTALVKQKTQKIRIHKIVVVSSGSTDSTDDIVARFADSYHYISLIREEKRRGKAAAINTFLSQCTDPVIVIESADTIPAASAIETLCTPFLRDSAIGMTGGSPHPTNNPETFMGYIIHSWWWFHRNIPRFGEIIAFRNIFPKVYEETAVDEAYIQAKMVQLEYKVVHIDDAVVYNKGPETVADLIKQRRRIFNGHARLHRDENIRISNMTRSSLVLLLFKYKMKSLKHFFWLLAGIGIEIWSRILGAYDTNIRGLNPFTWDTATTTKDLALAPEEAFDDSFS